MNRFLEKWMVTIFTHFHADSYFIFNYPILSEIWVYFRGWEIWCKKRGYILSGLLIVLLHHNLFCHSLLLTWNHACTKSSWANHQRTQITWTKMLTDSLQHSKKMADFDPLMIAQHMTTSFQHFLHLFWS